MGARNDLRAVEQELRRLGLAPQRRARHGMLWQRPGGGPMVLVPRDHKGGDPRAIKNLWAEVRRLEKEYGNG